jgi:hypothetical protein
MRLYQGVEAILSLHRSRLNSASATLLTPLLSTYHHLSWRLTQSRNCAYAGSTFQYEISETRLLKVVV